MNIQKLIEQYKKERVVFAKDYTNAKNETDKSASFGYMARCQLSIQRLKTLQKEQREWLEKNKRYSEEETTNPYLYEYEIKHAFGLNND